jgi:putative transposase
MAASIVLAHTRISKYQLVCSTSGKGNCYDNACAESFFYSLKVEAIHNKNFATDEEMRQTVFEYIEVDNNRSHRHSANASISPMAFEALKHA